jgi:small-conductance mechanosensitive channel
LHKFDKEFWTQVGFQVGIVILIILLTILVAIIARRLLRKKDHLGIIESIQYKFISQFIVGIIYFIGLLSAAYSIPSLQSLVTSLLASSGVLAIILGFASQQAFSNIVSGIFVVMFKPFRIGDRLKFADKDIIGIVEDISLRHTVIRTFDNKRIIVPNSVISNETLENAHIVDQKTVKFFEIGISYDSDIDKAINIIREEAENHSLFFDNRTEEEIAEGKDPVVIRVVGLGESSVNIKATIWAQDPDCAYVIGCDLNKSVKERFDREGIEIPFPHRTLVIKGKKKPANDS